MSKEKWEINIKKISEIQIRNELLSKSNPCIRDNNREVVLMTINETMVEYYKESIDTFGLLEIIEIRDKAYDEYGEELYGVKTLVLIDKDRKEEVQLDKIVKLARALEEENSKERLERLKKVMGAYTRELYDRYMFTIDDFRETAGVLSSVLDLDMDMNTNNMSSSNSRINLVRGHSSNTDNSICMNSSLIDSRNR